MKHLRQFLESGGWERRLFVAFTLLAIFPALLSFWPTHSTTPAPDPFIVATQIPKGFVLIPIEVQNNSSLDSILGQFGVVDLFQEGHQGTPQRLVARNVRLLRAPQNPTQFAVLVRESESSMVLQQSTPFTVVVKRPDQLGTEFVKAPRHEGRKIVYDGG